MATGRGELIEIKTCGFVMVWETRGSTLHDDIESAPAGFVELDAELTLVDTNRVARRDYAMLIGNGFLQCVHEDDRQECSLFLENQTELPFTCKLNSRSGHKTVLLSKSTIEGITKVWIQDRSVLIALQEQLQQAQTPNRKIIRNLHHLVTTALGYGELVQIMLDDNQVLSGNAHENVTRYHGQLMQYLQSAAQLPDNKVHKKDLSRHRNHILIVDDEAIIVEFLTELMQAKAYKVTGFTEPGKALKAFEINPGIFDLAIVDHHMPELDGLTFAEKLFTSEVKLPVVLCTNNNGLKQPEFVQEVLIKPVDINLLMTAVSEILN